jgi:hypothetical protein
VPKNPDAATQSPSESRVLAVVPTVTVLLGQALQGVVRAVWLLYVFGAHSWQLDMLVLPAWPLNVPGGHDCTVLPEMMNPCKATQSLALSWSLGRGPSACVFKLQLTPQGVVLARSTLYVLLLQTLQSDSADAPDVVRNEPAGQAVICVPLL